jgi:hypothetical protein
LLALGLTGCKLVDQRTFEPAASGPAAAALTRPDLPPLPLVTISFATPDIDWRPTLLEAVLAAQSRKADAAFEVVTPIPTAANQDVQDKYSAQGQLDGQLVARELQNDGVPADHVSVRFQGDQGAPGREVRVFAH